MVNTEVVVSCCLFTGGANVPKNSRAVFDAAWVDRLYRGVRRNYSRPFNLVCFTDQPYDFAEPVQTRDLRLPVDWNTVLLECYAVPARRLVVMGLDTVITGSLDELFAWDGELAAPRDPNRPTKACTGVVLARGPVNVMGHTDMVAIDRLRPRWLDDLFPGQVVSYKKHVKIRGLGDARIVYFHGTEKPHEVDAPFIREHWR